MRNLLDLFILVLCGAIINSLLVCFIISFQYIRGRFNLNVNSKNLKLIFNATVICEYVIFSLIAYIYLNNPYALDLSGGPGNAILCINPILYYLLIANYILICITAFNPTVPLIKKYTIPAIFMIVLLIAISCFVIFLLTKYNFDNYQEKENIGNIAIYISKILPTLIFIFILTSFRINKKEKIKAIFYSIIPLLILYFFLIDIYIKFKYLPVNEYHYYFDILGGYG